MVCIIEIIVKYNGDIIGLANELNIETEILNFSYAIMEVELEQIKGLSEHREIEYIEASTKLALLETPSIENSCINNIRTGIKYNLNGSGVLIAIIDSGIDYQNNDFINPDGTTRIISIWDQNSNNYNIYNPPKNFKSGTEYTQEIINQALNTPRENRDKIVAQFDFNGHGTAVAGIAAGNGRNSKGDYLGIAPEASLLIVKLAYNETHYFTSTTSLMRGVKYSIDKAIELNMPVVINISYGNNQGAHNNRSLFEQYLNEMSNLWETNIVIPTGNEGISKHHFRGKVDNNSQVDMQFSTQAGLTDLPIYFCKNSSDILEFQILSSSGDITQAISLRQNEQVVLLNSVEIVINVTQPTPYSQDQNVIFLFRGLNNFAIPENLWTIRVEGIEIVDGRFNSWLPVTEISGSNTEFINSSTEGSFTIPSTAEKVISVGGYDSQNGNISNFSGRGFSGKLDNVKPDIVAPSQNIISTGLNSSYGNFTGTSFASPHVAGACALLMQWGIVQKNDIYLYGQRLKSFLRAGAKRDSNIEYPNETWGYGKLCIEKTLDIISYYMYNSGSLSNFYAEPDVPVPGIKEINLSGSPSNVNITNEEMIEFKNLFPPIPEGVNPVLSEYYIDIITVYDKKIAEMLKDMQGILVSSVLQGGYAIVHFPIEEAYQYINFVSTMILSERPVICGLLSDTQALIDSGITDVKNQAFLELTGKGVLIGIIDTGIDYASQAFKYENDNSKILYLWDQSDNSGENPEGFLYGTEYDREKINIANSSENPYDIVKSRDEIGHGTFLASLISARTNESNTYSGAAPDSEIISVKLKPAKNISKAIEAIYDNDVPSYSSADVMNGIEYAFRKSVELSRPLVICLGLGSNNGAHDSLSYFERYLSELSLKNGVGIVSGVGNEGNMSHHFFVNLSNKNSAKIELNVDQKELGFMINIWAYAPDRISVSLTTPLGSSVEKTPFTTNETQDYNFILEGTEIRIEYIFPSQKNGAQEILIYFKNPTPGLWFINIYGDLILDGRVHGWLPLKPFISPNTIFLQSSPEDTIIIPSTAYNLINIGAYDSTNGSIYISTSRGPSISEKISPDMVAPGVNVEGIFPTGQIGTMTGTSVSTAVAAGACALMMQWGIVHNHDKAMNTLKLRSYLLLGLKQRSGIIYPSDLWGYGELDLIQTFQRIR
ncbi:MAG: S8 family serine peptidase [Candidatus Paraimprobicoccus trichonymphae]|uniref:S8 family serine peptidase n=1 Tax=Candidatus Paraimprobicoccus trichonymphae TaxID=3033793 RepID=A0AA48KYZ9_9FIRM|nr:MAG: S8 family serine peptidase [Candidatus Paraimprobicoccus trichonymphae]